MNLCGKPSLRERKIRRVGAVAPKAQPREGTLVDTLDRVLNRGVVVHGEVVLSVANIALVYVGLQAVVSSVETAAKLMAPRGSPENPGDPL